MGNSLCRDMILLLINRLCPLSAVTEDNDCRYQCLIFLTYFSWLPYVLQETNELHSESGNPSLHKKLLNDVCNATKLLDIEDDGLAAEDEFDGIDPALKEKLDR